jgi:hypothetical protein
MVEPISGQNPQRYWEVHPEPHEDDTKTAGGAQQGQGVQSTTDQDQARQPPVPVTPPIVNPHALALAYYGPNAKLPPIQSTSGASTPQVTPARAAIPDANTPPSAKPPVTGGAAADSGNSGVLGWFRHATSSIIPTVTSAFKTGVNSVVDGQRAADARLSQIGSAIDSTVQSAQHSVDSARSWLRQNGGGLGQMASDYIGFNEGAALGLYGMGKGIVQMADGASQLVNPGEWLANPQANLGRIQTTANAVVAVGKIADMADPVSWAMHPQDNAKLANALWQSGVKSFQGDPAKFLGNATATVATFFIPGGGEVSAVGDVAKVADTAADLSKVANTANDVTTVVNAANDTTKIVDTANSLTTVANTASDSVKVVDATSDTTAVASASSSGTAAAKGTEDAITIADAANDPAAGPVSFMRGNDRFFLNASNRADVDANGTFDVVAHGAPNKIQIQTANGPMLVDHRVAARLIQQSPGYTGQNIRLLSCSTGVSDTGFAQNLANKLGVEVTAPSDVLWAYPNGRMTVAPRGANGPDLNRLGTFRTFTPGKP